MFNFLIVLVAALCCASGGFDFSVEAQFSSARRPNSFYNGNGRLAFPPQFFPFPFPQPMPSSPTSDPETYKLCTYTPLTFMKCIHTVHVAENNSISLPLECVQKDTRDGCLRAVRTRLLDMIALEDHDYKVARREGLRPVVYESVSDDSLYVAVAPRNISLVDYLEAPIDVDQSNERAFHAAIFFNLIRGHNICRTFYNSRDGSTAIRIVDSAEYTPTDEEIILCTDRTYAEREDFKDCNVEAGLQTAIFVNQRTSALAIRAIKQIFDTILERFGPSSPQVDESTGLKNFNFFDTYEGEEDVIFNNNAISFDTNPTYRNGVNEDLFNKLHCNREDIEHDGSQLE